MQNSLVMWLSRTVFCDGFRDILVAFAFVILYNLIASWFRQSVGGGLEELLRGLKGEDQDVLFFQWNIKTESFSVETPIWGNSMKPLEVF